MNPNAIPIRQGHVRPANLRVQVPRCDRLDKADAICRLVSAESGYSVKELKGWDRPGPLADARMLAMYLCWEHSGLDLAGVAAFWDRKQPAIRRSHHAMKDRMDTEPKAQKQVERLSKLIKEWER